VIGLQTEAELFSFFHTFVVLITQLWVFPECGCDNYPSIFGCLTRLSASWATFFAKSQAAKLDRDLGDLSIRFVTCSFSALFCFVDQTVHNTSASLSMVGRNDATCGGSSVDFGLPEVARWLIGSLDHSFVSLTENPRLK